jgi:hypothetical protein
LEEIGEQSLRHPSLKTGLEYDLVKNLRHQFLSNSECLKQTKVELEKSRRERKRRDGGKAYAAHK